MQAQLVKLASQRPPASLLSLMAARLVKPQLPAGLAVSSTVHSASTPVSALSAKSIHNDVIQLQRIVDTFKARVEQAKQRTFDEIDGLTLAEHQLKKSIQLLIQKTRTSREQSLRNAATAPVPSVTPTSTASLPAARSVSLTPVVVKAMTTTPAAAATKPVPTKVVPFTFFSTKPTAAIGQLTSAASQISGASAAVPLQLSTAIAVSPPFSKVTSKASPAARKFTPAGKSAHAPASATGSQAKRAISSTALSQGEL